MKSDPIVYCTKNNAGNIIYKLKKYKFIYKTM